MNNTGKKTMHLRPIAVIVITSFLKNCLRNLQVRLNSLTEWAKEKFYNKTVNKLNGTQENAKAYWSLIKMFLNNKKIPLIPLH